MNLVIQKLGRDGIWGQIDLHGSGYTVSASLADGREGPLIPIFERRL